MLLLREETFAGEKVLGFSRILDKFAKVRAAKKIFVKIRESLSHTKLTSKANFMKIETDLFEYA